MQGAVRIVRKREEFNQRLERTVEDVCQEYYGRVGNSFYERRTWDKSFGRTERRSGEVVEAGPTRDAVDLGNLIRSMEMERPTPLQMKMLFRSPYAAKVFLGFITDSGKMIIGRPLPNLVAGEMDWHQEFEKFWSN